MAACWRALAAQPDIDLFVVAFQAKTETAFSDQLMADIPCHLLNLDQRQDSTHIQSVVTAQNPDVIVVSGWLHPPYRRLTSLRALRHVPFVMGMDTPWWGTWKQHLAPHLLRPYLRRMSQVVVTGERSWQYAWRLGIPPERIHRGLYGIDFDSLSQLWAKRQPGWPQSFLFLGRYVPAKGLDLLVAAYRDYRQAVDEPWSLVCCGKGPFSPLLLNQPGITDLGFVQPHQIASQLIQAGALILPSRFDPWPLALVEAAAAGLPIVCTEACGSAVEVVRKGYNGWTVPAHDSRALTEGLLALHHHPEQLPTWGQRSQVFAAAYSASLWADQWRQRLQQLSRVSEEKVAS